MAEKKSAPVKQDEQSEMVFSKKNYQLLLSFLQALILAIIEGLTEFLPVSSTGHMIIGSSVMGIATDPFVKLFTICIQLGAILSVVVLYFKRFFKSINFYII